MYLFLLYNVAWRIPDIDRWAQSKSNSRRLLYSDFPQTFLWRCSQDARQRDRKIVSKRVETCQGWLNFTLFTYVAYLFTYRYRLWGESFQDIVKCLHANVNCNYFTQYCRTLLRKAVTSDFFIYKCSAHVDSCSLKVYKNEWRSELGGWSRLIHGTTKLCFERKWSNRFSRMDAQLPSHPPVPHLHLICIGHSPFWYWASNDDNKYAFHRNRLLK